AQPLGEAGHRRVQAVAGLFRLLLEFGEVGQLEVGRESAAQPDSLVCRQGVQFFHQASFPTSVRLAAQRDGGPPHRLDEVEKVVALTFTQRVAEKAAQQPDLLSGRILLLHRPIVARSRGLPRAWLACLAACLPACLPARPAEGESVTARKSPLSGAVSGP